ncbi:MATE family efflux transporter [uncultured Acetatifactor sp.]|uniref:MATE family efflux transporter n=2 Tax=uncultured Acetatifactor sp. TaxID=1671927 RepID=UPI00261FC284|nr:MATE family efflux transporter [uncultured Acetatifactor sp.]
MKRAMTYEEKYKMMVETPVNKLIPRLAVPTIISMLITSIYNMADTFFVSQLSTSASGAVGVNFSLMAMIQAIGFTLGMGSGNYMSRMLGAKEQDRAQRACSTAVYTAFVLGLLLAVFGIWNMDALVRVLGATETIAPYARDYGKYILIAAPYMTVSFVFNNHLRSQGNAALSMLGITAGGVLNVILDPVLIFGFKMGISGAAIATIFSQFVSFLILLTLVIRSGNVLKPHPKFFTMKGWVYKEILSAGMPTLGRQGLASVASVLLNVAASGFGDAAVAAMSIVTRIMMFINSALIGFGQGFQPVCGFNFGAKRYGRVLEAYYFCRRVAFVFLLVMAVVMFAVSTPIMRLFRREDAEVVKIGALALKMQCVLLPIQSFTIIGNMLTQSIGYSFRATLTAIGKQGLFFIPAILILPGIYGVLGLQLAQPVADLLTFVLTQVIVVMVVQELKGMEKEAQG